MRAYPLPDPAHRLPLGRSDGLVIASIADARITALGMAWQTMGFLPACSLARNLACLLLFAGLAIVGSPGVHVPKDWIFSVSVSVSVRVDVVSHSRHPTLYKIIPRSSRTSLCHD